MSDPDGPNLELLEGLKRVGLEPGPFEDHPWPTKLPARVINSDGPPQLHGYTVEEDLSRHYSFAELLLLSLTGALPTKSWGRAFEVGLMILSPAPISQAPTNAAALAQMSASKPKGVLSVGAVGLAEQASWVVGQHEVLLEWLNAGSADSSPLPSTFQAKDAAERGRVDRLRAQLDEIGVNVSPLSEGPTMTAALLCLFYQCGCSESWQLESLWVVSRLGTLAAEAFAMRRAAYREYPMALPQYHYVSEQEHRDQDTDP